MDVLSVYLSITIQNGTLDVVFGDTKTKKGESIKVSNFMIRMKYTWSFDAAMDSNRNSINRIAVLRHTDT